MGCPFVSLRRRNFHRSNRERVRFETREIDDLTGVLDVDTHNFTLIIEIEDDPRRDLFRFDAGPLGKVDIERIGICEIIELHFCFLLYPRSKNALWTVSPSSRVTTRKYF